jgi:hypothetical protein
MSAWSDSAKTKPRFNVRVHIKKIRCKEDSRIERTRPISKPDRIGSRTGIVNRKLVFKGSIPLVLKSSA